MVQQLHDGSRTLSCRSFASVCLCPLFFFVGSAIMTAALLTSTVPSSYTLHPLDCLCCTQRDNAEDSAYVNMLVCTPYTVSVAHSGDPPS
jgi:hypothetical protein